MYHRLVTPIALLLALALAPQQLALAQPGAAPTAPLADQIPPDALLYVGWRGTDALKPAYQGSHLQAVVEASDLPALLDPFLPQLIERVQKENKDAGEALHLLGALGKPLIHYPSAFIFGGVEWNAGPNGMLPKVALLCQPGAQGADLEKQVEALLQNAPPPARQLIKVAREGDLLTISIGYPQGPTARREEGSLAATPAFRDALRHSGNTPAIVAFINGQKWLSTMNDFVAHQGDPAARENWPKIRDASGLEGVKYAVWTSGFDDKDWGSHLFVAAPAPRKGLLTLIDTTPLTDATLSLIPQTATMAGATELDAAKFIGIARNIASEVDPNAKAQFDQVLEQVSQTLGVNIEKDLLDSLGQEWAYYVDPSIGGRGLLGTVIVNHLRNPQKVNASLTKLEQFANEQIAQQVGNNPDEPKPQFFTTTSGTLTIHYLGLPVVTPCWAIDSGNLYIGLYPQVVSAAAAHVIDKGHSILENKDFLALRNRLGGDKATGFQFADLRRTAPDAYGQWLLISRLPGFADLFGVKSPVMLIPPLNKLLPQLAPAGAISWGDNEGWHARALSPFPGATSLASDPLGSFMTVYPMTIPILLPSLNRAREQANRAKSANNLRQIALASVMYADQFKGKFPDSIGQIVATEDVTPSIFVNPGSNTPPPPPFAKPDDAAKWVQDHSDYVYAGKGLTTKAGADDVLAYEKLEGANEGINIAYADGHVEWLPLPVARQKIEQIKK